jgi:AraC family transcriptional regulator
MLFWEGASLWILGTRAGEGHFPRTDFHSHHAVQVTLALRGGFTLDSRDRVIGGGAAAVAPDTAHAFAAEGVVAHLFIDPEGRPGRALQRALFTGPPLVPIGGATERGPATSG